jgi:hypothetical protein
MFLMVLFILTLSTAARADGPTIPSPPTGSTEAPTAPPRDIMSDLFGSPTGGGQLPGGAAGGEPGIHTQLDGAPDRSRSSGRQLAPINDAVLEMFTRSSSKTDEAPKTKRPAAMAILATSPKFKQFVSDRKNFKISAVPVNKPNEALGIIGDGTIGITVGDISKTCFLISRATDKVTLAMKKHIENEGGVYEYADNPAEVLKGIGACYKRIKGPFRITFCAHGREGYMTMGLWGLKNIDPAVAKMLAALAKLRYPIIDARFVSCMLGKSIDDKVKLANNKTVEANPVHIMRQLSAALDTYVMAFDRNLEVHSSSVATKDDANLIVVRLSDKGKAARAGTKATTGT